MNASSWGSSPPSLSASAAPGAVSVIDQALPLAVYLLLLCLSLWRLAAHWPAGCCWRELGGRLRRSDRAASTRLLLSSVGLALPGAAAAAAGGAGAAAVGGEVAGSLLRGRRRKCLGDVTAKFWFHLFLTFFSGAKTLQSALAVARVSEGGGDAALDLAVLVTTSVSICAYMTLLLFLEMHWREILNPLAAVRAGRACSRLATFLAVNAVLYGVVAVSIALNYLTVEDAGPRDIFWPIALTDAMLVVIALSYTMSAILLYCRVQRSLHAGTMLRRVGDALAGKSAAEAAEAVKAVEVAESAAVATAALPALLPPPHAALRDKATPPDIGGERDSLAPLLGGEAPSPLLLAEPGMLEPRLGASAEEEEGAEGGEYYDGQGEDAEDIDVRRRRRAASGVSPPAPARALPQPCGSAPPPPSPSLPSSLPPLLGRHRNIRRRRGLRR